MSSDHGAAPARFSLSKILKRGGIALIVLPFIAFLVWRGTVAIGINRLRQKSIDRGEPQTPAEIVAWLPDIKPGDNAAEGLLDIWEEEEGGYWNEWRTTGKIQSKRQDTSVDPDIPFVGRTTNTAIPWPAKEMAAARAFVVSRREHDEKTSAALGRPRARFPVHYAEGLMALLPHLMKVKQEVMAFEVENFLAIQEGSVADSTVALDQMARLAGTLRDEPFLISQLVRIASTAITLQGVEQLVSRQPLDGRQLGELTEILERLDLGDGYYRSMFGERALGLSVFGWTPEQLNELSMDSFAIQNGMAGNVVWSLLKYSGYLSVDQRLMMDTYDQILVLSTKSFKH